VYPNHTFQPKKIVTRAEMAEILYRLIKRLESQGYNFVRLIPLERIQVSDITSDNYYYRSILSVISYNIMSLRPDRIFNPDQPITGQKAINLFDIVLNLIQ
ncbi:MAG: S-layer homology domain-containing protein, partial [Acidobacteriota bacterium]